MHTGIHSLQRPSGARSRGATTTRIQPSVRFFNKASELYSKDMVRKPATGNEPAMERALLAWHDLR
jgi:hypothetical protein